MATDKEPEIIAFVEALGSISFYEIVINQVEA